MSVIAVPKTLCEKLGDDGVDVLITVISEVAISNDLTVKADMIRLNNKIACFAIMAAIWLIKAVVEWERLHCLIRLYGSG